MCVEPIGLDKISPFDKSSPFALLFWLLAIAFSSISAYLSYRKETALAIAVFIFLPFATAFVSSPFAGFMVSISELVVALMISGTRQKRHYKQKEPESGSSYGRREKEKGEKPKKGRWGGEEESVLDLPPPE